MIAFYIRIERDTIVDVLALITAVINVCTLNERPSYGPSYGPRDRPTAARIDMVANARICPIDMHDVDIGNGYAFYTGAAHY